jgi:hypothetical protein
MSKTLVGLGRRFPLLGAWGLWGAFGVGMLLEPWQMEARDFRVNQIPNGQVFGCANCHLSPSGGGARNAFGNRVFQLVGTSSRAFWTPSLAAEDSDGDGYCNGEELGDPDGDGVPVPGAPVTNPGVSTSRPANAQPVWTGVSAVVAVQGLPYNATAIAIDPNLCQRLTFSKVAGPAWLVVSTNGVLGGTPPEGSGGTYAVTLQVTDNGSPPQSAQFTYDLQVVARYAGWQALHFTLPQEAELARPDRDPDGDGLSNAAEYALGTNPRQFTAVPWRPPTFDVQGRMTLELPMRDDDPTLRAWLEMSDNLQFSEVTRVEGTVTDPRPGDGKKLWSFTDPVSRTNTSARFGRLRVQFEP